MTEIDVAIIGAGPAGTFSAKYLEEKGHSIQLVDKEIFPRNKPCAGILSPKIKSFIDIPDDIYERPLNGYRVLSPSGIVVESYFPEKGFIVKREKFDDFILSKLKNKPINKKVTKIKDFDDFVEILADNWSCKSKFVIGADGANSIVRKCCNIPNKIIAIAAQYEIKLSAEEIDNNIGNWFEVYYTLNYGYGWISPMKDTLKVGVGIVHDKLKDNIWNVLDGFMDQDIVKEKCLNGDIIDKETAPIPIAGPLDSVVKNRVFLVGDAGGFVYPGTGEGIFYAIKSGIIAGQVIDNAIKNKKFKSKYLENKYCIELEKNGLFSLRDVDFVEKYLSTTENSEQYVKHLKAIISKR